MQQAVGIPIDTNCVPLLADLFHYKKLAKQFNLTTLHLNISMMWCQWTVLNLVTVLTLIYPHELDIKYTTDSTKAASYSDLQLKYDYQGKLHAWLYHKYDDFDIMIVNFPHLSSNIPSLPAYFQTYSLLQACSHHKKLAQKLFQLQFLFPGLELSFLGFKLSHELYLAILSLSLGLYDFVFFLNNMYCIFCCSYLCWIMPGYSGRLSQCR